MRSYRPASPLASSFSLPHLARRPPREVAQRPPSHPRPKMAKKFQRTTEEPNDTLSNDEESSRSRWIGLGLDAKGWALAVDDASAGLEGVTCEGDDRR
ncbi:hypothetical protein MRB53_024014 [Persea americana]|uniref:Uncharacterized protein n=1 Tax=Persea americana TaxID=3435 RepID=A0ACC2LB92_PERAE|nr:hypothetical protein MRB53_024014 [Persea americana]